MWCYTTSTLSFITQKVQEWSHQIIFMDSHLCIPANVTIMLKFQLIWPTSHVDLDPGAELEDNTIQMKADLQKFMYQLRIQADVEVVEMVRQI